MRNALLTLAAILVAGMISLGVSAGVTAQSTPEPQDMNGTPVAAGPSHPAHIHNGTCATLGDVVAPLSDVSGRALNNGTPMAMDMVGSSNAIPVLSSVTKVDMTVADIVAATMPSTCI